MDLFASKCTRPTAVLTRTKPLRMYMYRTCLTQHKHKHTLYTTLQLFNKGLAKQSSVSVNWCPELGTVLANEEVINGLSERGDHPVKRLPLRQWILKITDYADRLEAGLDGLQWPSGTMTSQQQWIGKSEGCEIDFEVEGSESNEVSVCFP